MNNLKPSLRGGVTLIELLIVIAIIAMLVTLVLYGLSRSRDKAYDTRIKNAIGQIRFQAEGIYDTQGANYLGWTQVAAIQENLQILLDDIDKNYGDANPGSYVTVLRDTQEKEYCISAPLKSGVNRYACIDSTGVLQEVGGPCPEDEDGDGDPVLRCPSI